MNSCLDSLTAQLGEQAVVVAGLIDKGGENMLSIRGDGVA